MSLAVPWPQSPDAAFHVYDHQKCLNETGHIEMPMSASPLKRSLPGPRGEEDKDQPVFQNNQREASPATSTISALTSLSGTPAPTTAVDGTSESPQPSAKRRKLTLVEKQEKIHERAEKRAKREEDRLKREDEKRKRDEERRVRNEVLEEKRREKEIRKQEKEQVKKQEEEEKAKKERAQSRINSFFAKPRPTSILPTPTHPQLAQVCSDLGGAKDQMEVSRLEVSSTKTPTSDYRQTFMPFAAPSNSTVALSNYFTWDEKLMQKALADADSWFASEFAFEPQMLRQALDLGPYEVLEQGWTSDSVAALASRMDESSARQKIRLKDIEHQEQDARTQFMTLPVKYLFFREDVRPPYIGTISKFKTRGEALRLARCPLQRTREDIDYDYDSEAEWEEPEEGEDLGSDGDEDDESLADGEELTEFLDDEAAIDLQRPKRGVLYSDMQPMSTGLCWEDISGHLSSPSPDFASDLTVLRMETLSEIHPFPIDPFTTAHWPSSQFPTAALSTTVEPSRPSLQPRSDLYASNGPAHNISRSSAEGKPPKPQRSSRQLRLLSGSELEGFKHVVQGSELTKQGLLAVLKKTLPAVPNTVLSDTLGSIAARVGVKEADKRWVVIEGL